MQKAASNRLKHQDYLEELFRQRESRLTNRRIGSRLHELFSYENKKRALCAFDDKRYLLPCLIKTLAFGHKSLELSKDEEADFAAAEEEKTQKAIVRQKGCLAKRNRSIRLIDEAQEEHVQAKKARLAELGEQPPEETDDDAKDLFDEWPDYYMR